MICRLCLEEAQDTALDIVSEEAIQSNVASILYKYFRFCFESEPNEGYVCQKCWWEVKIFHAFYTRIEATHRPLHTNESVFVESDHLKIDLFAKDELEYEGDELKHCADEFRTAEYLRDRFGPNSPDREEQKPAISYGHPTELRPQKKRKKPKLASASATMTTVSDVPRPMKPSYKKNYKTRAKNPSKIYHCETCELPFLSEYKLYCHAKEVHLIQPFKCIEAKCVESYATQEQLEEHIKQNHSRVNCPHCNKMIKLYYLPLHIKFYHDKDQRIVCDLCGNVSNNINTHKSHHRLVHDVQPRLQCDICKDWSRNKNSMREHMRVRHIQGPETCSICGKVSANKKALMKHKKFHFAEAREKFKCNVCGRGFRDSTKLKEHSYIHSGISDVYRCNYCEKSFRFASSMYAHRKKAHPSEELYRTSQSFNPE